MKLIGEIYSPLEMKKIYNYDDVKAEVREFDHKLSDICDDSLGFLDVVQESEDGDKLSLRINPMSNLLHYTAELESLWHYKFYLLDDEFELL